MFDRETRILITSARILGDPPLKIFLEDGELLRLCAVIAADVGQRQFVSDYVASEEVEKGYYAVPLAWFKEPVLGVSFEQKYLELRDAIPDFTTYFKNVCELHKRRLKFQLILEHQPLPQMEQIVPRCLLEYGLRPSEALASWLVWRKWLYDIDNRSAQETGYLFEPILAATLGGISVSARKSPVRRTNDPRKGRQVDCLTDDKHAYEFKMRVTIAASGQGRFKEELDFAQDCNFSGFTPMLLVLDPTPSARLDDLATEYRQYGGSAYIGDDAWRHLEDKAGVVMAQFVERYIREPLREVDGSYGNLRSLSLAESGSSIIIEIGAQRFEIKRQPSDLLRDIPDDAEDDIDD